ncbi:amidase family protein [Myxosarcina sp. GI1]|uniref:amidase family protein n=1 Tax=Myxosarcina sp. GI1 TaxID=1541065 RepID=UPI000907C114|nr:amidase family protein [Myxosarcina sp. GI1]
MSSTTSIATDELVNLTVSDIQQGFKTGEFTSEELTASFLKRIDKFEPTYNAFTYLNPDALKLAKELDLEYETSGPRSPLHGVPIVIKDAVDIAGIRTTGGYAGFVSEAGGIDLIPELDAPIVSKLEAAGAVILGKTNLPAFSADGTRANSSYFGPTYNAYDLTIAPGASSSGSATAVAASFALMGIAEETGGSIQNPAGAQSLVGIKPTFGLVPNVGVVPLAGSTRDVLGPLTQTVYDAAITLDILAGPDPADPKTSVAEGEIPPDGYVSALDDTALEGKRLGLFGSGFKDIELTPETETLYEQALDVVLEEGTTVVEDPFAGSGFAELDPEVNGLETLPYDFNQYIKRLGSTTEVDSLTQLLDELDERGFASPFAEGEPLEFVGSNPDIEENLANPDVLPIEEFLEVREDYLEIFNEVLESNDLDGLVFPQMYAPVPDLFSDESYSATTVSEINILGTPGVTVPAGYYEDGSPFSLIFLGEAFSEADLLGYAYDYEQATMLREAPELEQVTVSDRAPTPGTLNNDVIEGEVDFDGKGNLVVSGKGSDIVDASTVESFNRLYGGRDNDELFAGTKSRLFGGKGNDILDATAGSGGNRLYGEEGDDVLLAGSNDRLVGGKGDDRLFVFDGGNNLITGDAGDDQFWIAISDVPSQTNKITDFTSGEDVLGIEGFPNLSFEGLNLSQDGDNAIVSLDEDTPIAELLGVQADSLTASDFTFA